MENQDNGQVIEGTLVNVEEPKEGIGMKVWNHLKRNWVKYVVGGVIAGGAVALCKAAKGGDEDDEDLVEVETTVEVTEE